MEISKFDAVGQGVGLIHDYPIEPIEARAALRRAGSKSLSSVGHGLATEMEGTTPEEKVVRWQTIVGPVLQAIWPIDVDIVQILKATGKVFVQASDVIIPLIRPDDPKSHSTV